MLIILFFLLIGFGFTLIGSIYLIAYMNLFSLGYNFYDYVNFIISRIECWYFIIGIIMLTISIYFIGRE